MSFGKQDTLQRSHSILDDINLLLVAVIWGSSYVTTKQVLFVVPIFFFIFLRFMLSAVIMAGVFWGKIRQIDLRSLKVGFILGLFLSVIFVFEISGIRYTSAANAGFIISLAVVLTPLVESFTMQRRPAPLLIGAAITSFFGCALLTVHNGMSPRLGDVLILGAAFARAIQVTYSGKLTQGQNFDETSLSTVQFFTVGMMGGVLGLLLGESFAALTNVSTIDWLIIIYLAVLGTCFSFLIQLRSIRRTSPTRVGILLGTEPVFAAIFAVAFGSTSLGLQDWIGGGLIIASAYLARSVRY